MSKIAIPDKSNAVRLVEVIALFAICVQFSGPGEDGEFSATRGREWVGDAAEDAV